MSEDKAKWILVGDDKGDKWEIVFIENGRRFCSFHFDSLKEAIKWVRDHMDEQMSIEDLRICNERN